MLKVQVNSYGHVGNEIATIIKSALMVYVPSYSKTMMRTSLISVNMISYLTVMHIQYYANELINT